jgi:uncharacterized cupredoxin-like copper-binding protein
MSTCAQAPPPGEATKGGVTVSKRDLALVTAALMTMVTITGPTVLAQEDEAGPVTEAVASEVNVTLQEFAVLPDTLSVPAGSVTFNATNVGPMDPHELVVVRTDIPAGELPTREDGSFDEDAEGVEVLGEIEEFDVGLTQSLTLDLEPGKYALLCNLVEQEDGETESHYQLGMWVDFEVTA